MIIKNISVKTCKNHIETEISFDSDGFISGCYLIQTVSPVYDGNMVVCQIAAGISSTKVLSCADAIPAIPSTDEKKYPYNLITRIFGENDVLIEERKDVFEFFLPERKKETVKKSFIAKLFGN